MDKSYTGETKMSPWTIMYMYTGIFIFIFFFLNFVNI